MQEMAPFKEIAPFQEMAPFEEMATLLFSAKSIHAMAAETETLIFLRAKATCTGTGFLSRFHSLALAVMDRWVARLKNASSY